MFNIKELELIVDAAQTYEGELYGQVEALRKDLFALMAKAKEEIGKQKTAEKLSKTNC